MRSNVGCVRKRRSDLFYRELIFRSDTLDRFSGSNQANHGRDVDSSACDARLPETYVGVHRDAREDRTSGPQQLARIPSRSPCGWRARQDSLPLASSGTRDAA